MNPEEFKLWYKKFLDKHGGFSPTNLDLWIDRVNSNHEFIRSVMGADLVSLEIELEEYQNAISDDMAAMYYTQMSDIIGGFDGMTRYLKGDIFEMLKRPTYNAGTHDSIKTAKHIRQCLERYAADYQSSTWFSTVWVKLEAVLSKLGEEWSKARTKNGKYHVTISTTPKAFALLGHYKTDVDSCFRQNGSSQQDKYCVGQSNNTFVITVAENGTNIIRAFGCLDRPTKTVHLANQYYLPGVCEGDAIEIFKKSFSKAFNVEYRYSESTIWPRDRAIVFINEKFGRCTFIPPSVAYLDDVDRPRMDTNLIKVWRCQICHSDLQEKHMFHNVVDDFVLCECCIEAAKPLFNSNKRTLKPTIEYEDENGNEIFLLITEEEKHQKYIKTCECGVTFISAGDVKECFYCKSDTCSCDICGKACKENKLNCIDDFDTCDECAVLLENSNEVS